MFQRGVIVEMWFLTTYLYMPSFALELTEVNEYCGFDQDFFCEFSEQSPCVLSRSLLQVS